jgi:hypothetical protein
MIDRVLAARRWADDGKQRCAGIVMGQLSVRQGDCRGGKLLICESERTTHRIRETPYIAYRIQSTASPTIEAHKMVPKPQGTAVQSATHRPLPPLPKLRVRRPNKPEANPCLGVMSSVLGTSTGGVENAGL